MKKYKLIKKYPGSPELGTVAHQDVFQKDKFYYALGEFAMLKEETLKKHSEFWQEIKKELPIGTKITQVRNKESIKETSYEKTKEGWYFGDLKVWIDESDIGEGKRFQIVKEEVKKVNPILFTSFDGVKIYEGDKYYRIISDWQIQEENAIKIGLQIYQKHHIPRFSSKEKAEEYILLNKPCLSINDVNNCYNYAPHGSIIHNKLVENLKELVKSKL